MPSSYFSDLTVSIQELKRIYIDSALSLPVPTEEQQEHARAFVVLAHAEMEWYLESAFRSLSNCLVDNAKAGNFSSASMAYLTFTELDPQHGGETLGVKKTARSVATRICVAQTKYNKVLDDNHGVKEKYIAPMAIPLGFKSKNVDSTWLNELETFCANRGAFAHMTRLKKEARHLDVNPFDMWSRCERLIWNSSATSAPNLVSSFESLDFWIEGEKQKFSSPFHSADLKLNFLDRCLLKISHLWSGSR